MANLMAVGQQDPKPMTLNDRVANASSDIANLCELVQGMLTRTYGAEPLPVTSGGPVTPGQPAMTQNVEWLEGHIKRLYGLVERLHGIA